MKKVKFAIQTNNWKTGSSFNVWVQKLHKFIHLLPNILTKSFVIIQKIISDIYRLQIFIDISSQAVDDTKCFVDT